MHLAEFRLRLIGGALVGSRVGNVDFERVGADVEAGKLGPRDLELRLFDVGEHDIDAVARQRPADAEPDAIGGAGDERRLAGEVHDDGPAGSAAPVAASSASNPAIIAAKRCAMSPRRSLWV